MSIRINTLKVEKGKIYKDLSSRGIKLLPVEGLLEFASIVKKSETVVGGSPEYLAGFYTIQGISSFFPVISLSPEEGEKILDIAAAPGGKTSFISQLMKNSGLIIANDKNKFRIKSLVNSIHRLSVKNSLVTNYDGSIFPFIMKGFDKVLIDAPCTGTGIISHDKTIKTRKTTRSIWVNSLLQQQLLLAAIDSCNENSGKGGYIVYSTCSILVEENESVIQYALDKRGVQIVPTGLDIGMPGYIKYKNVLFDPKMKECKRFFPHIHNTDGFFICKLKKIKK
mmetsp:Transcript_9638/g.19307  ORF Transcript_9638/g.19307 Transcript_9638/m.19307 type:complete len:281 (-) Transcript_9638:137-979(-)